MQNLSPYHQLAQQFEHISHLEGATSILHWDSAVMMPTGGAQARSGQLATLKVLIHQATTQPHIPEQIALAEQTPDLTPWQHANLREIKRTHLHASAVPTDLIKAMSQAGSDCEMTWRQARKDNDFKTLAPKLQTVIHLTQQIADIKATALNCSPYEALLDQYEPQATTQHIDHIFDTLLQELPDLIQNALDKQAHQDQHHPLPPLTGNFNIPAQKQLGLHIMKTLGFNFDQGRLDISHHPFCGGLPGDIRITTRYQEQDFTQSLMGIIHETGHALYEQGLPPKWLNQPVGRARGMSVHESQSLFMEMQLGRSQAFIEHITPIAQKIFQGHGDAWTPQSLQRHYTRVARSLIRVDADEVTYPAHVILRYKLEQALLSGDLQINDLPGAWNEAMQKYVGITPPNDTDGCMQDIHWMDGSLGYFPTYTLGAMTAAQLAQSMRKALPQCDQQMRQGDFTHIVQWLREHIHSKASLYNTNELLTHATGRPLEVSPFIDHLRLRYT